MKRFLFTFVLLARIAYGQPPPGSDTICLPVTAVQDLVTARDQKKVLVEQVGILNDRIANYEQVIRLQKEKDTVTILSHAKEIKLMLDQRVTLEAQIADLNRTIKRERFNRTMRDIGWGVVVITMGVLYINK